MGRFLTLSAFFILALLTIAATIPSFVDWQSYREPIERAAGSALGREVKITGRVGFTILPYPSVDLGGVTVSNPQGAASPNLLTLETLSAKLALAPLLRGAVKIETFQLEGANLKLERGAEGNNWSFAKDAGQGGPSAGVIEGLVTRAIRDISIEDFSAKDLKISFVDTVSGQTFDWEIKHGQASLASIKGPFEAEGRVVLGGEAFYVTGKLGTSRPDKPRSVALEAMTADGLELKFDGSAETVGDEMLIRGHTRIKAPAAHQLGIPFAAVTGSSLGAWGGGSTLNLPASLVGQIELSAGAMKGTDLEITVGSTRGLGALDLEIGPTVTGIMDVQTKSIDLDELLAALGADKPGAVGAGSGLDVKLKIKAGGATLRETALKGGAELSVDLVTTGPTLGSFKAVLPGKTQLVYSRNSGAKQRGALDIQTDEARAFLTWLGVDLASARPAAFRTLKLSGDVIVSKAELKLTGVAATLDGIKLEGALVRTRSERPALGANVKVLGLDLERFGTGTNVEQWLDYMSAFDVNAIIKLRQFTGFNLERRSVDIKAQMVRGALTLEDVQIYGTPDLRLRGKLKRDDDGALTGKLRIDAKQLALCSAIEARSSFALPGCARDPKFKATGKFTLVGGKATGEVVATSPALAFEGVLEGAQTLFAPQLDLVFDGKGEVGSVSYVASGTAGGARGAVGATAHLEAEAPKFTALLETLDASQLWSPSVLALIENRGAARLVTDLTLTPGATGFDAMSLEVGPGSVAGSGRVERAQTGKTFDVKLSASNLTLLQPHGDDGWSTRKLDLVLPKDLVGTLDVAMTNTVLGGLAVSSASFKGAVKSGGLDLNISEAAVFDGKWDGDVSLRQGKGGLQIAARGKARDVDLRVLLTEGLGATGLSGLADVTFDVSSDGRSWKSLVENAAGMLDLKARKGSLRGFDLAGFTNGLKDAAGELGARLVVEGALSSGTTHYTNLDAEMTLASGKLRTISLVGDLDSGTLTGEGEVDLANLNWKGRTVIDLDTPGNLPKIKSALSGRLNKPRVVWDAEELVLKFTEAWLLSNQSTDVPELPGAGGSGVSSEELGDLPPPQ